MQNYQASCRICSRIKWLPQQLATSIRLAWHMDWLLPIFSRLTPSPASSTGLALYSSLYSCVYYSLYYSLYMSIHMDIHTDVQIISISYPNHIHHISISYLHPYRIHILAMSYPYPLKTHIHIHVHI